MERSIQGVLDEIEEEEAAVKMSVNICAKGKEKQAHWDTAKMTVIQ